MLELSNVYSLDTGTSYWKMEYGESQFIIRTDISFDKTHLCINCKNIKNKDLEMGVRELIFHHKVLEKYKR